MTIRERQTDLTRAAILDAAVETFEDRDAPFTVQEVADRAGVSHRTVYRHFEGRQELMNEMGRHLDRSAEERAGLDHRPETVNEVLAGVGVSLDFGAENAAWLRRALTLSIDGGEWRTDRDERYWKMFRDEFSHLPEDEARADWAAFRHLIGAQSQILYVERFELDREQAVAGLGRAGRALIADVRKRDRAAAKRSTTKRESAKRTAAPPSSSTNDGSNR